MECVKQQSVIVSQAYSLQMPVPPAIKAFPCLFIALLSYPQAQRYAHTTPVHRSTTQQVVTINITYILHRHIQSVHL